jgi:hypothetical protein
MNKLDIDQAAFAEGFARAPFAVTHRLAGNPLLSVDAIADLAGRLPEDQIEHNRGDLHEVQDPDDVPRLDASPREIAQDIDSNGCWMVLKNIEDDPDYRELLHATLGEVEPLIAGREGGMGRREGFIFLSAPGSVTPSHIDPEHNLLLQIRGSKTMKVGRFPDARSAQLEVERFHAVAERNLSWRPQALLTFPLFPGDGVYIPVFAPHLVRNGPVVSVSLSITFFTPQVLDANRLHAVNARIRRLGLSPPPPGARPRSDRAKLALVDGVRRIRGGR